MICKSFNLTFSENILHRFRYRHELFDNGFGIEWTNENEDDDDDDDQSKKMITEESINEHDSIHHHQQQQTNNDKHTRSIITVRAINNNATRLPAHIWRSLAKVSLRLNQ